MHGGYANFYSRPCGRGDEADVCGRNAVIISTHAPAGGATYKVSTRVLTVRCISTHAPAGGATWMIRSYKGGGLIFLLTPLREGRRSRCLRTERRNHFYSRPCGRGDGAVRSGRRGPRNFYSRPCGRGDSRGLHRPGHRKGISTHAPAGGATRSQIITSAISSHFYSRPCGRGDLR